MLGIVFIVLKLCGVIGWHWAWVLAPFWMPLALAVSVLAMFLVAAGLCALAVAVFERGRRKPARRQARKPWFPASK